MVLKTVKDLITFPFISDKGSSIIIKFARVNAEKTTTSFIQLTQVHSQASPDPEVIMIMTGLKGDGLLGLQASGSSG